VCRKYGTFISRRPLLILCLSLAVPLLLCIGFVRFEVETRPEKVRMHLLLLLLFLSWGLSKNNTCRDMYRYIHISRPHSHTFTHVYVCIHACMHDSCMYVSVRIVIRLLVIVLLGFYPIDPYPSLVLYKCIVSPLLINQFLLRVSIFLHGIRARETLTLKFSISKFTFLKILLQICKKEKVIVHVNSNALVLFT